MFQCPEGVDLGTDDPMWRTMREGSMLPKSLNHPNAGVDTMNTGRSLPERASYLGRALSILASHPWEGVDRLRGRVEIALSEHLPFVAGQQPKATTSEPLEALHSLIGAEWPCTLQEDFADAWMTLERRLAHPGFQVGEGHDADSSLAHVVWCAIRHMRPKRVLETGVARGVTSALILGAMSKPGSVGGHLWSIDLPPVMPGWHAQSKALVDDSLCSSWTYIRGSSRRVMRDTCAEMQTIDVFIHDSLHTRMTMNYEFNLAWTTMHSGSLLISDDVEGNAAFMDFVRSHGVVKWFIAPHEQKRGLFAVAIKE